MYAANEITQPLELLDLLVTQFDYDYRYNGDDNTLEAIRDIDRGQYVMFAAGELNNLYICIRHLTHF